jgi:F-type H+-transporting ATPase subunit epsilon
VRDESGKETDFCASGGFLEVSNNAVVILADAIEGIADIDLDRARTAEERARERLSNALRDASIDVRRAEAALARAANRRRLGRS